MSLDPLSTQYGLDRFQNLADYKQLSFNLLKSCIVILGPKKEREELENKFTNNPPHLYGEKLKLESSGSYLGDELGVSVSESVTLTINKRVGLVKKAIFEIKYIVEDCRSNVSGGIQTGLLIWESCIVPFLFNNCSTWYRIKDSDIKRLIKLQNLFLNVLLGIQNCPTVMLYWDLAILCVPLRILKHKLSLYHHISCLPENALAKKILAAQERH